MLHIRLYTSDEGCIGINLFPELPFGVWTYLLEPCMVQQLLSDLFRKVVSIPAVHRDQGSRQHVLRTRTCGLS